MLKGLVCAFAMLILLPLTAAAQETPKVEIFGGYSYLRVDDNLDGVNLHGWNASVAGNVNRWFGLVGDFSGHYGSPTVGGVTVDGAKAHLFLFGPQISKRGEKWTVFARTLVGGAHASSNAAGFFSTAETALAVAIGGGVDVNVNKTVAIRLFQADYVLTRFADESQHNFRLSTGLVLRLGNK